MKTIEQLWEGYRANVLADAGDEQRRMARLCFWAGAAGMLHLVDEALMMEAEPARAAFEALQAEIVANFNEIRARAQGMAS